MLARKIYSCFFFFFFSSCVDEKLFYFFIHIKIRFAIIARVSFLCKWKVANKYLSNNLCIYNPIHELKKNKNLKCMKIHCSSRRNSPQ
jgi:hypothetical protein